MAGTFFVEPVFPTKKDEEPFYDKETEGLRCFGFLGCFGLDPTCQVISYKWFISVLVSVKWF